MGNILTDTKPIFNGTHSKVWAVIGDKEIVVGDLETFKATQTNIYEDVNVSGVFSKQRKLVGVEFKGECTKFKTNSNWVQLAMQYQNGITPDISIISKAENVETKAVERIKLLDVTFDELTLADFQQKTLTKESLPFVFGAWEPIEL